MSWKALLRLPHHPRFSLLMLSAAQAQAASWTGVYLRFAALCFSLWTQRVLSTAHGGCTIQYIVAQRAHASLWKDLASTQDMRSQVLMPVPLAC